MSRKTNEYEFTLIFALPEGIEVDEQLMHALYEASCDDATVASGRKGRVVFDFNKEATSAEEAIISAIQAIKGAIPGAKLLEASPDLVSLSEIAQILDRSRQSARNLVVESGLPIHPVHTGTPSVWHLADVLHHLSTQHLLERYNVRDSIIEVASFSKMLNITRASAELDLSKKAMLSGLV